MIKKIKSSMIDSQKKNPGMTLFWYLLTWQFLFGYITFNVFHAPTQGAPIIAIFVCYMIINGIISVRYLLWLSKYKRRSKLWIIWGIIPFPLVHVIGVGILGERKGFELKEEINFSNLQKPSEDFSDLK